MPIGDLCCDVVHVPRSNCFLCDIEGPNEIRVVLRTLELLILFAGGVCIEGNEWEVDRGSGAVIGVIWDGFGALGAIIGFLWEGFCTCAVGEGIDKTSLHGIPKNVPQ